MTHREFQGIDLVQTDGGGDNLQAVINYDGRIQIEVEEPWAGDTETGFGRSGAIQLNAEQALQLADWLVRAAAELGKGG